MLYCIPYIFSFTNSIPFQPTQVIQNNSKFYVKFFSALIINFAPFKQTLSLSTKMKTKTTKILHFDRHSWHTIQLESCATRVQTISLLDRISEGSRLATGTSERRRAIKKTDSRKFTTTDIISHGGVELIPVITRDQGRSKDRVQIVLDIVEG